MHKTIASKGLLGLVLLSMAACTGCTGPAWYGPNFGMFSYPIPVSPWTQNRLEENFIRRERYSRVPVLGPVTPGAPETSLDPPTDDEVMRALEDARPIGAGLPFLHEVQRSNVRIAVDPIADYFDPPRVYPLIGPAQLHHAQYKCTVYFTETTRVGWPIPYTTVDEDGQEVLYIDHDHFHMVGNLDPGPGSNYPNPPPAPGH
jgi:hypothetical protein